MTLAGRVAPFGYRRIKACSQLPDAFRSVPRPSSPLGAKASTECPYRARYASCTDTDTDASNDAKPPAAANARQDAAPTIARITFLAAPASANSHMRYGHPITVQSLAPSKA